MIRHDEATPIRLRRRLMYSATSFDLSGKLHYPHGMSALSFLINLNLPSPRRPRACRQVGQNTVWGQEQYHRHLHDPRRDQRQLSRTLNMLLFYTK